MRKGPLRRRINVSENKSEKEARYDSVRSLISDPREGYSNDPLYLLFATIVDVIKPYEYYICIHGEAHEFSATSVKR